MQVMSYVKLNGNRLGNDGLYVGLGNPEDIAPLEEVETGRHVGMIVLYGNRKVKKEGSVVFKRELLAHDNYKTVLRDAFNLVCAVEMLDIVADPKYTALAGSYMTAEAARREIDRIQAGTYQASQPWVYLLK